jgi:hypothetical protein
MKQNACVDCDAPISDRATRCNKCSALHRWSDPKFRRRAMGKGNPNWRGGSVARNCKICGKEFHVVQAKADSGKGSVFCSRKCMGQWQAENWVGKNHPAWKGGNVIRTCRQCGKQFEVRPHVVKDGGGKFCSYTCLGQWNSKHRLRGSNNPNWRGGKLTRICANCGKEFQVQRSRVKQGWGKYCSQSCSAQARTGNQNSNWRGGKIPHQCKQCGETFWRSPSSNQTKFCSQNCCGEWMSENMRGENSPNWREGKSFEPYGIEFDKVLKSQIRERDGHVCALCKKSARCVHHIDYDKTNNLSRNLITLCRKCHSITNGNRDYWQAYFTGANHSAIMAAIPRYIPLASSPGW